MKNFADNGLAEDALRSMADAAHRAVPFLTTESGLRLINPPWKVTFGSGL